MLPSTLFQNTLSLHSLHKGSDQLSHSYKTSKIVVLYFLMFIFLDIKLQDKRFFTE